MQSSNEARLMTHKMNCKDIYLEVGISLATGQTFTA